MKVFLPSKWKVHGGRNFVLGQAPPHPPKRQWWRYFRGVGSVGSGYSSAFPQANLSPNCSCVTLGTLLASRFTYSAECS